MYKKCYEIDWSYTQHWQVKYTSKEALKIIKKLCRHFKITIPRVYFTKHKNGSASIRGYIKLPKKDISLGIIDHEIGHLLAFKNSAYGHTKKAYKYIKRVYAYTYKFIPEVYYLDYTNGNDIY